MGIIRRLLTTGEHIGHASEEEARAFFTAKASGGSVGAVVTPEGQTVTLHEEATPTDVEASVRAHTDNAGQRYQGTGQEDAAQSSVQTEPVHEEVQTESEQTESEQTESEQQ